MDISLIKEKIRNQVSSIDDVNFLEAIATMLDTKLGSEIIVLSDDIKNDILKSKIQYEQNEFISDSVLNEKMEKWLKE